LQFDVLKFNLFNMKHLSRDEMKKVMGGARLIIGGTRYDPSANDGHGQCYVDLCLS
jgi:natural product precursor